MIEFVDSWIDAHEDDMVRALQGSVRISSVQAAPLPGAPFGQGCRDALDYTLRLCESLGFTTGDLEGYAGYADAGEGEQMLAVLSHLDVVPAGEGWSGDPFSGDLIDGKIMGRGSLDNKGPSIASIFALAALKASGLPFKRKVRLIFGCNEESGMRCMEHYRAHAQIPDIAFTPDGYYPLVQSEKHILHTTHARAYASSVTLKAGTAVNVVPGKAVATVSVPYEVTEPICSAFAQKSGFGCTCERDGAGTSITMTGVFAHGSLPENGKNTVQSMLALFTELPLTGEDARIAASLNESFAMEYNGERLGIDVTDDSGRITINVGLMDWNSEGISVSIDIRHPISLDASKVNAALDGAFAKIGAERVDTFIDKGMYVAADSELYHALMGAFEGRFGKGAQPLHIGGGTYARRFENAAAFGPALKERENDAHVANEFFRTEYLFTDAKVIADAIAALAIDA